MKSSRSLHITDEAEADLLSILRFSERNWGQRQQETYGQRIADALQRLVQFPGLGRSRDDIGPGWHSYPVGEHIIFYLTDETSLIVTRILHRRMDASHQLE